MTQRLKTLIERYREREGGERKGERERERGERGGKRERERGGGREGVGGERERLFC